MSRDVLTVGSTMKILLLYRGEYSQWVERFMNYLEEQADGEAMINSIKNGDQPLPRVTQVSIARTSLTEQPPLKDKSINKTAKDLWDALARHMLGSEYGEKDRKAAVLQDKMSRDVITIGSIMRIPLLYRGKYSQWHERFMNFLEEQTDGEAMINSIQNSDQPLPVIAQVSLARNAQNAPPTLKDPKFWTAEEKNTRKIDRLARSLLIQGISNDIYSLIDSNETAKDLWDALERQMCGSEYGEQDRKAAILYEYETFKATKGENLLDTYLHYLQVINDLKKCGYKKDNYYKKAKVKENNYYKTKMLLAKKDSDEQVLLAEDLAWMESS
nr:hypothetical protein [Tanacetum cinerariifolium]